MQQYYQYYQYYQQSSLQRPAGIPQDTMLADPWTLGHTNQMEGPIDPRHIQLAQFSTIDGPNGFATPTCEQPGSLVDFPSPSPHPKDIKPINSRTIKQQLTGRIEFNTDVDQLLRAIHREDLNGATAVKEEPLMLSPSPSPKGASMLPFAHPPTLAKMFRCTQPGCNGVFSQKAHLTTHTRVHTGEKPYVSCPSNEISKTGSLLTKPEMRVPRLRPALYSSRKHEGMPTPASRTGRHLLTTSRVTCDVTMG